MAMSAGNLRHRIAVQKRVQIQNPTTGALTHTWQTLDGCESLAAEVLYLSAREFIAAQATQSEIVARITIRYRSGLNASMRIVHKGQVFNPKAFLPDDDSGLEYLTIPVTSGVNEG